MIYIFWTCRDKTEAKNILRKLLNLRLIACASIFPEIESIYRWEGKIEESVEVKVILKTVEKHFHAIESYIRTHCSYGIPEISRIEVLEGNLQYLAWIERETA